LRNKQTTAIFAIIAAFILFSTILLTNGIGSASAAKPSDPDCFGKQASRLGQSGGMGEHASSFAGEARQGIGNLADHPSEIFPC
jgi:hypothetical protein